MDELESNFSHYADFKNSNGMIILEMLEYKKLTLADLFPILGSTSVATEYLLGKRVLSAQQLEKLAELFGVLPEVFVLENLENKDSEQVKMFSEQKSQELYQQDHEENVQNEFISPFSQQDSTENTFSSQLEEENEFSSQAFQAKPFWED